MEVVSYALKGYVWLAWAEVSLRKDIDGLGVIYAKTHALSMHAKLLAKLSNVDQAWAQLSCSPLLL